MSIDLINNILLYIIMFIINILVIKKDELSMFGYIWILPIFNLSFLIFIFIYNALLNLIYNVSIFYYIICIVPIILFLLKEIIQAHKINKIYRIYEDNLKSEISLFFRKNNLNINIKDIKLFFYLENKSTNCKVIINTKRKIDKDLLLNNLKKTYPNLNYNIFIDNKEN